MWEYSRKIIIVTMVLSAHLWDGQQHKLMEIIQSLRCKIPNAFLIV